MINILVEVEENFVLSVEEKIYELSLGKNISTMEAEDFIFGLCIFNDWSARDLQREEMPLSLGPAKGKDFATSFGPFMVTPDELEDDWRKDGNNISPFTRRVFFRWIYHL